MQSGGVVVQTVLSSCGQLLVRPLATVYFQCSDTTILPFERDPAFLLALTLRKHHLMSS